MIVFFFDHCADFIFLGFLFWKDNMLPSQNKYYMINYNTLPIICIDWPHPTLGCQTDSNISISNPHSRNGKYKVFGEPQEELVIGGRQK